MRKTRSSSSHKIDSNVEEKGTDKKKNESSKNASREKTYNVHQKRILEKLQQKKTSAEKIEKYKKDTVKLQLKTASDKLKANSTPISKNVKKNKTTNEKCVKGSKAKPGTNEPILINSVNFHLSNESSEPLTPEKQNKRNSMEKRLKNLRNSIAKNVLNQNENISKFNDLDKKKSHAYSKATNNNFDKTSQKICTPQNSDREIIQKNDKAISDGNNICSMDWEEMDGNMQLISNVSSNVTKTDYKLIVVDTNILLKHLRSIQNATNDNIKIDNFSIKFVIPWRVLCELDGLKENRNSSSVSTNSRAALKYLHDNLSNSSNILGQSLKDANDHVFECPTSDDEILNCCLQLVLKKKNVTLLSNDISLCNKALANNIQTLTHEKFVKKLCNQSKISVVAPECLKSDKIFEEQLKKISLCLNTLLSTILEGEMKRVYDDLWLRIVLLEPPWSLIDVMKSIKKHWIAVFSESFPRSFQSIICSLLKHFIQNTAGKNENRENFDELKTTVLELCEICVKLPAYKMIALSCIKEIKIITKLHIRNLQGNEIVEENALLSKECFPVPGNNNRISNYFQVISNGFDAFCSQLANLVGVPHDIKTTEMNIPIPTLLAHANDVSAQLSRFISTLHRTLSIFAANATATETEINDVLVHLKENIISTSHGMGHEVYCNDKDVASFCILERNSIEKIFLHFSELYELLLKCSKKCSNK